MILKMLLKSTFLSLYVSSKQTSVNEHDEAMILSKMVTHLHFEDSVSQIVESWA